MGIVVQIALVTCTCIVDVRAKLFFFLIKLRNFKADRNSVVLETYRFLLNDLDNLEIWDFVDEN